MSATTERVKAELDGLLEPLKRQLVVLEKEIEITAEELAVLRATRSSISKTLTLLDPSFVPAKKVKVGGRPPAERNRAGMPINVSPGMLSKVSEYLSEHRDNVNVNGGFSVMDLISRDDFNIASRATITNALNALHERGFLHLDHVSGQGGKYFKVVG